jgi:hypothetical protein
MYSLYAHRRSLTLVVIFATLSCIFWLAVFHAEAAIQQNFRLTSPKLSGTQLTLRVGDVENVTISITNAALGTDIRQVKAPGSNSSVKIEPTDTGFKLTALQSSPPIPLTFNLGDDRFDLTVTVLPRVAPGDIKINAPSTFSRTATNKIWQKRSYRLTIDRIGTPTREASDLITLNSSAPDVLQVTPDNNNWTVIGLRPETAKIQVKDKLSGELITEISFEVAVATQNISVENSPFTVRPIRNPDGSAREKLVPLADLGIKVVGTNGLPLPLTDALNGKALLIGASSAPNSFTVDENGLLAKSAGEGTFTLTSDNGNVQTTVFVKVEPVSSSISFNPPVPVVIVGQAQAVVATVLDDKGLPRPDRSVIWQSDNISRLAIVTGGNGVAQLVGIAASQDDAPVKVTATVIGEEGVKADLFVFVRDKGQVLGFSPLDIRLEPLDEQIARDLFGKKTIDDFYITKVRLYNNLRNGRGENIGDSILVFSESLEANVSMEKKREKGGGDWESLTNCDISVIRGLTQLVPFNNSSNTPPVTPSTPCSFTTSFPAPTPAPAVNGTSAGNATTAAATPAPTPPSVSMIDPNYPGRYRPYTFEMVANSHDRRDDRSLRSRALLIANSLGSLTSVITAVAVPGPSSDLPLGLDKYQNLLIPSFEKLFPSLRESQRINLINETMRPLEEVPYGSDVARIVFFPKKPLKGILPGYVVRFTGISNYNLTAEVAIIKKTLKQ